MKVSSHCGRVHHVKHFSLWLRLPIARCLQRVKRVRVRLWVCPMAGLSGH